MFEYNVGLNEIIQIMVRPAAPLQAVSLNNNTKESADDAKETEPEKKPKEDGSASDKENEEVSCKLPLWKRRRITISVCCAFITAKT